MTSDPHNRAMRPPLPPSATSSQAPELSASSPVQVISQQSPIKRSDRRAPPNRHAMMMGSSPASPTRTTNGQDARRNNEPLINTDDQLDGSSQPHPSRYRGYGQQPDSDESFGNASHSRQDNYSQEPSSQLGFSQTQLTQRTQGDDVPSSLDMQSSQINPRNKYWAVFSPISPGLQPMKLHWAIAPHDHPFLANGEPDLVLNASRPGITGFARLGRATQSRFNDIVFSERRISNTHCRIERLDNHDPKNEALLAGVTITDDEPVVAIQDLGSSNGTYVNGVDIKRRKTILKHGDEVSLGSKLSIDDHDVRYIFRSVGRAGEVSERVGGIFERYHFRELLGSGSFADVKKAIEIETGVVRAVKIINKHKFMSNPRHVAGFQREIEITESLHHENICQLIEVFEDPREIYLVLELVQGGDLLNHIMTRDPALSEQESIYLTRQICRAIAYTHALGVAHRDLKPENILITSDNPPIVKVADFGLAKMVVEGTIFRTMVGTPQYVAPEIVMQTAAKPGYDLLVDSWSIGVIVFSMMSNAMPFEEDEEQPIHIRIRDRNTQPWDRQLLRDLGISETAIDFISRLLEPDPAKRMSGKDALEHPWLAENTPAAQLKSLHPNQSLSSEDSWNGGRSRVSTVDGGDYLGQSLSFTGLDEMSQSRYDSFSRDDYSYPLDRLRLETPQRGNTLKPINNSSELTPKKAHRRIKSISTQGSPGSGNLKESQQPEEDISSFNFLIEDPDSLEAQPPSLPPPPSTVIPAFVPETQDQELTADQQSKVALTSTLKRKLTSMTSGSDLSSLPDSEQATMQVVPQSSQDRAQPPSKRRQNRTSVASSSTPPRISERLRTKKTNNVGKA